MKAEKQSQSDQGSSGQDHQNVGQAKVEEAKEQQPSISATDHSENVGILPIKDTIQFEDFTKLDLRVAYIHHAEAHPNADRLLTLTVHVGEETMRTVCAGIAEAYQPQDLIGKKVVLLANLKPRKIRGIKSEGMLLASGQGKDIHVIMLADETPIGSTIA